LEIKALIRKTITEADILLFSAVSTDANPAHIDEEYAKTTIFKRGLLMVL